MTSKAHSRQSKRPKKRILWPILGAFIATIINVDVMVLLLKYLNATNLIFYPITIATSIVEIIAYFYFCRWFPKSSLYRFLRIKTRVSYYWLKRFYPLVLFIRSVRRLFKLLGGRKIIKLFSRDSHSPNRKGILIRLFEYLKLHTIVPPRFLGYASIFVIAAEPTPGGRLAGIVASAVADSWISLVAVMLGSIVRIFYYDGIIRFLTWLF